MGDVSVSVSVSGLANMDHVSNSKCPSKIVISGKYMEKHISLLWKLLTLLLLGISGIFMCFVGVDQRVSGRRSKSLVALDEGTDYMKCQLPPHSSDDFPVYFPKPRTYNRGECACIPVHKFVIFSMQRTGSGWFETLLNDHPNINSHGEIFAVESRRELFSQVRKILDSVYNLDWNSSASKDYCTTAVGFKWMLNQGVMEYNAELLRYLQSNRVSVIFLFRRNILRRYVSILANVFDKEAKLLNGTHQAHVHTKVEAEILARYEPIVNVTFLPAYLERIRKITSDALSFFNTTRHTVIYYEDIRKPEKLGEIQQFLGVLPRSLKSRHVKIHTKHLSEQIQNWEEVVKRLKGTKFEELLLDF